MCLVFVVVTIINHTTPLKIIVIIICCIYTRLHHQSELAGYGKAFDRNTGDAIPAIAFLRGDSVAVLIVVKVQETGRKYVLVCKQLRFPSGGAMIEACAGMFKRTTETFFQPLLVAYI